ncbi:MAG: hypothetical protein ABEJ68_08915 [Halobacteriaceae archaeon]
MGDEAPGGLSPDEAFALLGSEPRIEILQALGTADGSLTFSALFDRVDYETTANFSYHLDRLDGQFLRSMDDGYALTQAGQRVVEAVLSGAVTQSPVVERTPVSVPCSCCGGALELSYRNERVGLYCPHCGGTRGEESDTTRPEAGDDVLGTVSLPPAGVRDRTPEELLGAAEIWTVTEAHAIARGVCPRCSAAVTRSVRVCEDHDGGTGRCDRCDQQFGVTMQTACTNCVFEEEAIFTKHLLADPDLMAFMLDHGVDPIAPEGFHVGALEEMILSADPFEAAFSFRADSEVLTLTVGEDLSVTDVTRERVEE